MTSNLIQNSVDLLLNDTVKISVDWLNLDPNNLRLVDKRTE